MFAAELSFTRCTRRELLRAGGLLALGAWPGALRAAGLGQGEDFTFFVVNDLHYQTARCGAWFERVIGQMKATNPRPAFCLIVGDFAEHGTRAEMGPVRELFATLGVPTFEVIGNHDYTGNADRSVYEKLFPGRLNYSFEHAGWQFVGLDSTEGRKGRDTTIQPETLRWLQGRLPKLDKQRPMVLFTHFPLGFLTPCRPLNANLLLEGFRDYNLQAVFNGHFHGSTVRWYQQATVTTNRCCAISRENHDGTPEKGYFLCSAKEGKVMREFVEVKPA